MQQVPEPSRPVSLRIGDAERDAAIERLRTAHSEGRITADEFDERMTAALQARTEDDLTPLFLDLPAAPAASRVSGASGASGATAMPRYPVPGGEGSFPLSHEIAEADSNPASSRWLWVAQGLMWPAVIVLIMASRMELWWLIFVPIVFGRVMYRASGQAVAARQQRAEAHAMARQVRHDAHRQARQIRRDARRY